MSEVELVCDGPLATVTINRPAARNAIALATMEELEQALHRVQAQGASALVLRGAGDRAFVAGGDLKDLARIRSHEEAVA
ncbi:MAG TPA: enoyl-CoA hydratase-related protein, partial [Thermomicrobiales bacterium]|nr:enoyl-CoA hydratase-related protein [Thermomicrobiales bacterium]